MPRPHHPERQTAREKHTEKCLGPQIVARGDQSGMNRGQQRGDESRTTTEERPRQHSGHGDHQDPGRNRDGHEGCEERAVARVHLHRLTLRKLD